ncbi:potassium channel family protein [Ideonella margarita]|uniref:Potassium channel family protein n=1 Tax=Ideonella margarita TaxID=2984191 RepID=A0ABU9C146_9BURK
MASTTPPPEPPLPPSPGSVHHADTQTFMRRLPRWGLSPAPHHNSRATRIERMWRWPTLVVLLLTVPAFYADLLQAGASPLADATYLVAALVVAAGLWHVGRASHRPLEHALGNPTDLLLVTGLVLAAALPSSQVSSAALGLRLLVAFGTLLRMVWATQHLITRGGLTYLLTMAVGVLLLCGLGFWWLEPTVHTLGDGLWLAFTTAATVGYGDVVPTTPAAKIFSVFVVLLGFGVLTLVTAAIATSWVETEERRIEREIMRDMRREMASVRHELVALRRELESARGQSFKP